MVFRAQFFFEFIEFSKEDWLGYSCRYQINIGTRTFSTVAVVNILGFVSWQIFEGYLHY